MVDPSYVLQIARRVVSLPDRDEAYLERMVVPLLEFPEISAYLKECKRGLDAMLIGENPAHIPRLREAAMTKIVFNLGLIYGREEQKEACGLEHD